MTAKPSTPWGPADSIGIIAPGITRYSTSSHGGIHLSPERIAELPPVIAAFPTFAGPGWYEEDCDVSLVVLAFPQFFEPGRVEREIESIRLYATWSYGAKWLPVLKFVEATSC
jgi:hypothetical protein